MGLSGSSHTCLSVVIITKNEALNISNCIDSVLPVADEIIIYDSGSTDNTCQLAASFPRVKVHLGPWFGYAISKNHANSLARFDWILSLDADEQLSEELVESILIWKKQSFPQNAGFKRLTNYCGSWVRHCGWYPDTKWRLFNRNETKWEGDVHEILKSFNPSETNQFMVLTGDCLHFSYKKPQEHWEQTRKFAKLWADQAYSARKKPSKLKMLVGPFFRFLIDYFLKLGILDGSVGIKICFVSARGIAMRQRFLFQNWSNSER